MRTTPRILAAIGVTTLAVLSASSVGARAEPATTTPVTMTATVAATPPATVIVGPPPAFSTLIVQGRGVPEPLSEASRSDLATLAEQTGKDLDTLIWHYRGDEAFDVLANDLTSEHGSGLVQAGFSTAATGPDVWMRFTDAPSEQILARISALPYTVQVQYGAALSWKRLETLQERAYVAVQQYPGVHRAVSEIDPLTDTIMITYSLDAGELVDAETLRNAAISAVTDNGTTDDLPVQLAFTDDSTLDTGTAGASTSGGELASSAIPTVPGFRTASIQNALAARSTASNSCPRTSSTDVPCLEVLHSWFETLS